MAEIIKFFTNPMSRGQIARWMLEETGASYETVILDYGPSMKAKSYLAVNPMGKVPAIQHGDHVVTEAAAICAYLAEAFPEAKLAPTEAERADYFRWTFFAAGPVEHAVSDRFVLDKKPTAEQERTVGYGNYDRVVEVLANALSKRDFICGSRFTAADVYVGSSVDWGVQFKTLPDKSEFTDYAARLRERPAYKKAKAIDSDLIAKMDKAHD